MVLRWWQLPWRTVAHTRARAVRSSRSQKAGGRARPCGIFVAVPAVGPPASGSKAALLRLIAHVTASCHLCFQMSQDISVSTVQAMCSRFKLRSSHVPFFLQVGLRLGWVGN